MQKIRKRTKTKQISLRSSKDRIRQHARNTMLNHVAASCQLSMCKEMSKDARIRRFCVGNSQETLSGPRKQTCRTGRRRREREQEQIHKGQRQNKETGEGVCGITKWHCAKRMIAGVMFNTATEGNNTAHGYETSPSHVID